jgi:probable rRNA maturation factor
MIEVNNLTSFEITENFFQTAAKEVLRKEKKNSLDLSLALLGEKEMKKINKDFRKNNRPTDVLSFNYGNAGEIIICPDYIKKNARNFGIAFEDEFLKVLIHGILHILGYNHEGKKTDAKKMEERQNYYFNLLKSKHKK